MLRVGFVGELGYEIHVPASCGPAVWRAIWDAGQRDGIRPFGTEAQRLLRLEKGYVLIRHDTDALTNPYEAGLGWTVSEDKPFFVGQRSLAILKKQTPTRKLVGFAIDANYDGPLPEECHLVIERGEIVGRVTSVSHRSTVGGPIGLAFVSPQLKETGTKIHIRVEGGKMVAAKVVALPFYDRENQRQAM